MCSKLVVLCDQIACGTGTEAFRSFRNSDHSSHQQKIAGTGARDVKQMALTVVNLFEIGIIGDILDALWRGNDLVVARHYRDGAKVKNVWPDASS